MISTTRPALPLLLALAALPLGGAVASDDPKGRPDAPSATVARVIDGDTVELRIGDATVKARIVGIDAPESVHPRKPVERFGKEAAKHLRELAADQVVTVEREPGSKQDRYGRELVYLRLADGRDVGRTMIRDGFAHAYPKYPHSRMDEYRKAEREAREAKAGLWGDDPPAKPSAEATVYVTRAGAKYHAEGCRHLRGGGIPLPLAEAAKGRSACKVCKPPVP